MSNPARGKSPQNPVNQPECAEAANTSGWECSPIVTRS